MYADLHIHTQDSDGECDIFTILSKVKAKEVSYFSICDHNTIAGSAKMYEYLKDEKAPPFFIPGVEISVLHNKREHHLLFYTYEIYNEDLLELLGEIKTISERQDLLMLKKLKYHYKNISLEEYEAYCAANGGGGKLVSYLLHKNILEKANEYSNTYWQKKEGVRPYPDIKEVMERLEKISGKVILAHPSSYCKEGQLSIPRLDELKELRIDGIECYSPYCTDELCAYYAHYCIKNKMIITIGSNFHGEGLDFSEIGKYKISIKQKDIRKGLKKIFGGDLFC